MDAFANPKLTAIQLIPVLVTGSSAMGSCLAEVRRGNLSSRSSIAGN